MTTPTAERAALEALLADLGSTVVAFSGGVDSAVVAAAAWHALGARALAVTAAAESLASSELDHARGLAREIGIAHEVVTYSELDDPVYSANPKFRCYVCQGKRMDSMLRRAAAGEFAAVVDGTNASDPGPDRPGLAAIRERGVRSPLLELGIAKPGVRALARELGLSAWDRPANACLSSRIPHGQPITLGKLRRVERAEAILADLGFRIVRVRHDEGGARVEVGASEVARLAEIWPAVAPRLTELGFAAVRFSSAGYRRGGADPLAAAGSSAS